MAAQLKRGALDCPNPWDMLYRWSEDELSLEGQEMLVSLLIEPHGPLVDDLAETMSIDESALFRIDATQTVAATRQAIEEIFDWALEIDFDAPAEQARFWYVSEESYNFV